jgi:hypothetical protein
MVVCAIRVLDNKDSRTRRCNNRILFFFKDKFILKNEKDFKIGMELASVAE